MAISAGVSSVVSWRSGSVGAAERKEAFPSEGGVW